uniref:Uncharacterized protein n=1 Tax=Spongospora subterranea TaxID=70186 RepID=A0A0H5QLH2_9EUKA|eukprot:CRZ02995.1 hypothetical protein [Spongospora subterranea]
MFTLSTLVEQEEETLTADVTVCVTDPVTSSRSSQCDRCNINIKRECSWYGPAHKNICKTGRPAETIAKGVMTRSRTSSYGLQNQVFRILSSILILNCVLFGLINDVSQRVLWHFLPVIVVEFWR